MDICLFMLNEKTKGRKIRGQIEEERERKGEIKCGSDLIRTDLGVKMQDKLILFRKL